LDDDFIFNTIAIIGAGLIGGSLGMAAKRRLLARRIIGIGRTEQKMMRAKILGAIDDYSLDFETGASEADLVVICTPVRLVVPTLERIASGLKEGAIVTDVGSTKREIVAGAEAVIPEGRYFVGGHPMAGSEQSGIDAAFPDLFLGATYVITPTEQTNLDALGKMTALAEGVGARVEIMSPDKHDDAAAVVSHLPHALAGALLQLAEDSQRESGAIFKLAAGSFRDLTRISDSPPEIWRDICVTNADSLSEVISRFAKHLGDFKAALDSRDEDAITSFFQEAAEIRQAYLRIAKHD
jgi:prephenate dehydrogenase